MSRHLYPALVAIRLCSACGLPEELCDCAPVSACEVCQLPEDACYCGCIELTEDDIEFLPPQPPLIPSLPRLGEEML